MNWKLLVLLSLLVCESARGGGDRLDEPHFTLKAAKAIPIALKQFRKDQPKAEEEHFDVYIREKETSVEVEFVPEASPRSEDCGENQCSITVDVGGGSVYGFGIIYVLDKRSARIIDTIRAR